jgi:hypothetical protein
LTIIQDYIDHGFKLVPIPPNSKGPFNKSWNQLENCLTSEDKLPNGFGVGLAHAYSGTMALDIDNMNNAYDELMKHEIDLSKLMKKEDAVFVLSGKPNRAKLLYKMPEDVILPSKKINHMNETIFELRCATHNGLTVQDVLPPSIHPDTKKPYEWRGDWKNLPLIPDELLTYWKELAETVSLHPNEIMPTVTSTDDDYSLEDIKYALTYISSSIGRDEWIRIGMALHWYGSSFKQYEDALKVWDEWSQKDEVKYPGHKEIVSQWHSFKIDKNHLITPRSIFQLAFKNGWRLEGRDIFKFFKDEGSDNLPDLNLTYNLRMAPPKVDLDLWPRKLASRAEQLSHSTGGDPLASLWAGLAAICAVADARTRLELAPGFLVPPILWLMVIGEPGGKKSPGTKPMLKILGEIEAEDHPDFRKKFLEWEALEAAHASAKKAFLAASGSSDFIMSQKDYTMLPDVPEIPEAPVPLRLTVFDITSQKLVRELVSRPRGVLCSMDEMNSWVKKMVEKNSGEDRSSWVVSYESEPYKMDRVSGGSFHVENMAVSILGNIQPAIFRKSLSALAGDGLLQRFLPVVLTDNYRMPEPVPEFLLNTGQWNNIVRNVFSLPTMKYVLSEQSYNVFREFQQWYQVKRKDERLLQSSDVFMTAFGKLEGTCGRLILIFHMIEDPYSVEVKPQIVERVVQIVKSFIVPSLRYAFSEIGGISSFETWLNDFVMHYSHREVIEMSLIKKRAWRILDDINPHHHDQLIMDHMAMLEASDWVVRVDEVSNRRKGSAQWIVSSRIAEKHKDRRIEVMNAKQRRMDEMPGFNIKVEGYVKDS